MLRSRPGRHTALVVTALLVSAGCSSLPTSPPEDRASRSATTAEAAESGGMEPIQLQEPLLPDSDPSPEPMPVQSVQTNKLILGALGGQVKAGDFTVIIPPLAIKGAATVTVRQPDVDKPYVSLHVWPATANDFQVPVILVADASRMDEDLLKLAVISWYNPATGKWEPQSATTVNLLDKTVICPLGHFSDYAVEADGKAGW
jgi:hypothetical protein